MLPPSSASIGSIIFFSWFCDLVVRSRKSVRVLRSLLVFCNQHCENRSQQHENERLHKSHEHFQEIEWNWQNGYRHRIIVDNASKILLAGKIIPNHWKTERNGRKNVENH